MKTTALHLKDCYKIGHPFQYPEITNLVYSNFTPRSGRLSNTGLDYIIWCGIQGVTKWLLIDEFNKTFFNVDKITAVAKYKRRVDGILGPDAVSTDHIEALHDLGYLPVELKALPEGSKVPYKVPVFTIKNTHKDEQFGWVTNMLETMLSAECWKMPTVATTAHAYRLLLEKYAERTGSPVEFVDWQGHDFSMRGMSGIHDASQSGLGHLLSFLGTDTVPAIDYAEEYYGANVETELVGGSVPASEHSVMCAGGKDDEVETIRRLIKDVYPSGVVSIVSDTWDFWNVVTNTASALKEDILNREPNALGLAKTVFRPDCYDSETQILTNKGFKLFKDLKEEDKVAQVLDNGHYEFVKPLKYVAQEYQGDMYKFSDQKGKIDLLVTPNHRMIINQNGKEKIIFAEEMSSNGYHGQKMMRSARQGSGCYKLTNLERLMIAFQADGSFQTGTNKIRFSFSKQRKMERLESILNEEEIGFNKYFLSDGRVEYNIDINAELFSKDFSWVDVPNISYYYAKEFIEELSYWDATRRSENRFKFDTTNELVIKSVELISIAAGYGVLISKHEDNRKEHFSDVYTAHIMKDNTIGGQAWKKEKVQYDGKVYCVQVPSGKVIVKRNNSTLVCGNSGDPVKVICGYTTINKIYENFKEAWEDSPYELYGCTAVNINGSWHPCGWLDGDDWSIDTYITLSENEVKGAAECLWDIFGGTETAKGYKVLNERVGLIYGDSITLERAKAILSGLEAKGFASCNIVFGIGSYTYQYVTRDTHGFAMKATYAEVNGEGREIFKDPVTDSGTKKSAKGLLRVEKEDGKFVLYDQQTWEQEAQGELQTVFKDGKLVNETSLAEIREHLKSN